VRERVVGHNLAAPRIVHLDGHAVAHSDAAAAACLWVWGAGGVGGGVPSGVFCVNAQTKQRA
jgi:hypothetical protein